MNADASSPLHLPRLRWHRGGEATLQAFDGKMLTCLSTVSAAPGTPLAGESHDADGSPVALLVKVRTCKQTEPGRYVIWGRLTNATRLLCEQVKHVLP